MKTMRYNVALLALAVLTIVGCGEKKSELEEKKAEIDKYKAEMGELQTKLKEAEADMAELDPDYAMKKRRQTLVGLMEVRDTIFSHYVEVRGTVSSRRNINMSAETSGMINSIMVREGDEVKKGHVLASIDAVIAEQNIAELRTQMELSKTMYERQKNLWDKNIGTEIQYLQAKNNHESLQRKLSTLQTQRGKSILRAPFDGVVESILALEGEMAQPGMPIMNIVSPKDMYVSSDLSENYIGKFKKGDSVIVKFPALNKSLRTTVSSVGQVINAQNRTFPIEVRLPNNGEYRPNMLAVMEVRDFVKENAVVIPSPVIQQDNKGHFVFVVQDSGDHMVAVKQHIDRGLTFQNRTLVTSGLRPGQKLINRGQREVADGATVTTGNN